MDKRDYLGIGLKLIGVYAGAILGIPSLVAAITGILVGWPPRLDSRSVVFVLLAKLLAFLTPIVYLGIAYLLIKNCRKCVDWCMTDESGAPS
jgi:hypothetical protein